MLLQRNTNRFWFLTTTVVVVGLLVLIWLIQQRNDTLSPSEASGEGGTTQQPSNIPPVTATAIRKALFFEENLFLDGVTQAKKNPPPNLSSNKIIGGITPHHLLPSTLLSRFWQTIAAQHPKTIIIIGPNHYEAGSAPILSSTNTWETPFGNVAADQQLIDTFFSIPSFALNDRVIQSDHSVTGSLPYIKYYSPNSTVVPLLISNRMNLDQITTLATALSEKLKDRDDVIIVAAIDFSHYLNAKQAAQKDEITAKLMEAREYERIMKLSNDYVDSPAPLPLFLMLMDSFGSSKTVLLDHSNSGELLHEPNVQTTSYFSEVFVKK